MSLNDPALDEDIVEPNLAICDSHHHLWHKPGYDYLLPDYLRDVGSGHRIVSSVFVECGTDYDTQASEALAPVGETCFADESSETARGYGTGLDMCAAIVGFADLTLGAAIVDTLDAHIEASRRFRGIRHCAALDPSPAILSAAHSPVFPGMLASDRFRAGFGQLESRQLSFDMWVYHPQLGEVAALANAFPGTTILLDHIGGALGIGPFRGRREEMLAQWKAGLRAVARCPNVSVKLGGVCMPLNGLDLHKRDLPVGSVELAAILREQILFAIDQFGVERCLFESNYPADRPSVRYAVIWNSFKRIVADFSAADKAMLFQTNAERLYRIGNAVRPWIQSTNRPFASRISGPSTRARPSPN